MHDTARSTARSPVLRYFEDFLPTLFGRLLIPDLESLTTCFAIEVTDLDGPPWRIGIEAGRLVSVGQEGPEPLCTFRLDGETLLEVASAQVLPAEAFFAKRIDLEGDMEHGLKLSTVLAPFFAGFPFHADGPDAPAGEGHAPGA
jgi:predicted lipid carrier protein YhbT